jgi:hypothetical protein
MSQLGKSSMTTWNLPLHHPHYFRMGHCIKCLDKILDIFWGKAYIISGYLVAVLIIQEA